MMSALARLAAPLAAAATVGLAAGGGWFIVDAWTTLDPGAYGFAFAGVVLGIVASVLALVWTARGTWHLAAPAALLATAVPTGTAYLGNGLSLALGIVTLTLAVAARRAQAAPVTLR